MGNFVIPWFNISLRCDEFKKRYGSWEESPTRIIILDLLKLLKKNGYYAKGLRDQVGEDET